MKSLKTLASVLLIPTFSSLFGCSVVAPLTERPRGEKVSYEIGYRGSFEPFMYHANLDKRLTTLPYSGCGESGELTTSVDGAFDFALKMGLYGSIGDDNIRLKAGTDARFNFGSSPGYRSGIYDTGKHPVPKPCEQYNYLVLEPDELEINPFVGVDFHYNDGNRIGFEVGYNYSKWEAQAGYDMWGGWRKVESDFWEGRGTSFAIESVSKDFFHFGFPAGVRVQHDRFNTGFGKINRTSLMFSIDLPAEDIYYSY